MMTIYLLDIIAVLLVPGVLHKSWPLFYILGYFVTLREVVKQFVLYLFPSTLNLSLYILASETTDFYWLIQLIIDFPIVFFMIIGIIRNIQCPLV